MLALEQQLQLSRSDNPLQSTVATLEEQVAGLQAQNASVCEQLSHQAQLASALQLEASEYVVSTGCLLLVAKRLLVVFEPLDP
jgi:uncharacterized protein YlxW (UPF0749 family)